MPNLALMVDRNGVLNTASLDLDNGKGWQGPHTVGAGNLVPGSVVTVFQACIGCETLGEGGDRRSLDRPWCRQLRVDEGGAGG